MAVVDPEPLGWTNWAPHLLQNNAPEYSWFWQFGQTIMLAYPFPGYLQVIKPLYHILSAFRLPGLIFGDF